MRVVAAGSEETDMIVCPCIDCRSVDRHLGSDVVFHYVSRGMDEAYKLRRDWYHHGEVNVMAEGGSATQRNVEIRGLYQAAEYLDEELVRKDEMISLQS